MTKKRKRYPDLNQKLERPWCYYCERDFDDLKILISHQKAKHFKCDRCGRRLNTAGGLNVHMNQVHKETLSHVENAIPGRQALDVEIFGMEGVPQEIIDQHNQQVTHKHFEEEQERARVTGNPIRGMYSNGTAPPTKKAKVKEEITDLAARAAQFRVDKANGVLPVAPIELPPQPSPPVVGQPYGVPAGAPPSIPPPFIPGAQQLPPPGAPSFPPGQGFPMNGPPGFIPGYGAPPPFNQGPSPVGGGMPPRPGSIPGTGLPQRPPFGAPPLGAFPPGQNGHAPPGHSALSASVDDLISSAVAAASTPTEAAAQEKKEKTKKDRNIKLVYFDETLSPEEKMATLSRYALGAA